MGRSAKNRRRKPLIITDLMNWLAPSGERKIATTPTRPIDPTLTRPPNRCLHVLGSVWRMFVVAFHLVGMVRLQRLMVALSFIVMFRASPVVNTSSLSCLSSLLICACCSSPPAAMQFLADAVSSRQWLLFSRSSPTGQTNIAIHGLLFARRQDQASICPWWEQACLEVTPVQK